MAAFLTPFPRFYPVLPSLDWIERLAPLGIKVVQLRLKEASEAEIKRQISQALEVCAAYNVQLIVNDYWQFALELGADYVHLGQEDLAAADLQALKAGGLKLGVSTHSEDELAIALMAEPDYVALGPIYETVLKKMSWAPQGLAKLSVWRQQISVPLIAIGGLNFERAQLALEAGADSAAVVTDIVTATDPEAQVREWVQRFESPQPLAPSA